VPAVHSEGWMGRQGRSTGSAPRGSGICDVLHVHEMQPVNRVVDAVNDTGAAGKGYACPWIGRLCRWSASATKQAHMGWVRKDKGAIWHYS